MASPGPSLWESLSPMKAVVKHRSVGSQGSILEYSSPGSKLVHSQFN